jgi:hypothetical protein
MPLTMKPELLSVLLENGAACMFKAYILLSDIHIRINRPRAVLLGSNGTGNKNSISI